MKPSAPQHETVAEISAVDPMALDEDRRLLIVDDDKPFLSRLSRAMEARGFEVLTAESVAEGLAAIAHNPPA